MVRNWLRTSARRSRDERQGAEAAYEALRHYAEESSARIATLTAERDMWKGLAEHRAKMLARDGVRATERMLAMVREAKTEPLVENIVMVAQMLHALGLTTDAQLEAVTALAAERTGFD